MESELFQNPMPVKATKIHLASAFDLNYITPFYVLLTSLFHNNKKNSLVVHTIATGINEKQKAAIADYVRQNGAEILFYGIDEAYVRNLAVLPKNKHFTVAVYYRLFLPSLLPAEVQKLLYIDTDTVVVDDLKPLYETAIGIKPFAAIPDSYPHIRTDLGLEHQSQYFNSGVLLIDVQNWLVQQVTEKAIRFMADHPERIKYVDQDALNATQKDNWVPLEKKYNVTWFDVPRHVSRKKLADNAVIIHYTTAHKPWNALGGNKLRYVYHGYLKKSPHANRKKYVDFKWNGNVLKKFFFIRFLEWYYERPALVTFYRKITGRKR